MDAGTALARIATMCAADREPTLDIEDLDFLLGLARRPDIDGLVSTDASWTPTWDLNLAVAEGWRIKAGRVAHRFNFVKDGQTFDVGSLRQSFLDMATRYQSKTLGSVPLSARSSRDGEYVIGNR